MENGTEVREGELVNETPETAVKAASNYIGGTIKIVADAKTGAISVEHPQNVIIALGIIETAKSIIVQKQQEAVAKMQEAMLKPSILRPTASDFNKLKPS